MAKLNPLITTANGNLSQIEEMIVAAISRAEAKATGLLRLDQEVDVMVTNRIPNMLIKEDGVGGYTHSDDLIVLEVNESIISEDTIYEMLCHELCHAKRLSILPNFPNNLTEAVLNEGLATFFESTIAQELKNPQFFIRTVTSRSDQENQKILQAMSPHLKDVRYDDAIFFYSGKGILPRWSGYSVGYYIVKEYSEQTNLPFLDILSTKYSDLEKFAKKIGAS